MHLNGNDFRFWTDLIFWQKFDLAQRPISPWWPWRRYRHGAFCCVGHQKKAPPHVSYKAKCPFGTTAVLQVQTACLAHALHGHVIIWIPMARNSILKKSHVLFWTASILFSVWISALISYRPMMCLSAVTTCDILVPDDNTVHISARDMEVKCTYHVHQGVVIIQQLHFWLNQVHLPDSHKCT